MGGIVDKGREGMWTDGKECGLGIKRKLVRDGYEGLRMVRNMG
jgi:hypothetical protein